MHLTGQRLECKVVVISLQSCRRQLESYKGGFAELMQSSTKSSRTEYLLQPEACFGSSLAVYAMNKNTLVILFFVATRRKKC